MRLEELSKFALALNSPNSPTRGTPGRTKRLTRLAPYAGGSRPGSAVASFTQPLAPAPVTDADQRADVAQELGQIRSVEDLHIDHRRALSIKRGDLAIIQGEVFRCCPAASHLADQSLILKRLDCVDRRTYDLKVYEADQLARFLGHPNIVTLYSYWATQPQSPYVYKTLVLLMEEGLLGDALTTVVQAPERPSTRQVMKYACDLAKGLQAVHNCNIVHGRVKPSSIYLSADNTAMLGEFGKTELDSARQTHQLFSKLLIGDAIPSVLVYWAPELLQLREYGKQADMWSLGVTLYQLATGAHPFNVEDEHAFRDEALLGEVDMSPLAHMPRLATIVTNLIKVNPDERWTAAEVLQFAQHQFAVDIQRVWRGYEVRKEFRRVRTAVVKIQAVVKCFLTRQRYAETRERRRLNAAIMIQSAFRRWRQMAQYQKQRDALLKCQGNVLCRQTRAAYTKFRADVVLCQACVRRFLAMSWYSKVRLYRGDLQTKLTTMQSMVAKYQASVSEFRGLFPGEELPPALAPLASLEDFELAQAQAEGDAAAEQPCLPKLRGAASHIDSLEAQLDAVTSQLRDHEEAQAARDAEEAELREKLGSKYAELEPMMQALRKNLARVEGQVRRAVALPASIQHTYSYSKWDQVHNPENVVENVLSDADSEYSALSPAVDLTLCDDAPCFISEVIIEPGACGPANLEVYTSNTPEKWSLVSAFRCSRDEVQAFQLPGEQVARYMRLRFPNNTRGGNIVALRRVTVKGLPQ